MNKAEQTYETILMGIVPYADVLHVCPSPSNKHTHTLSGHAHAHPDSRSHIQRHALTYPFADTGSLLLVDR